MGIRHLLHVLTVPPTKAYLLCTTPAGMDLYIQVHAQRLLPSVVPWISEDCLLRRGFDYVFVHMKENMPMEIIHSSGQFSEGSFGQGMKMRWFPVAAQFLKTEAILDTIKEFKK